MIIKKEIKNFIESKTRRKISITQRCNWNDYQFTYHILSRGMVNTVRTLLDKNFITPVFDPDEREVKSFFVRYSKGKRISNLRWFDFFVYVIKEICDRNNLSFPQLIRKIRKLTSHIKGDKKSPAVCPPLTEKQIIYALIRRYGTSFNSFLTEKQLVVEMKPKLKRLGFGVRLGTIKEDRKGADVVIYKITKPEKKFGINVKASKHDVVKTKDVDELKMKIISVGMSGYRDIGDLTDEDYNKIFKIIRRYVTRNNGLR